MEKVSYSERGKSIAFTGHRIIPSARQEEVRKRLTTAVTLACKSGMTRFYCGMALGFDMMAAEVVLSLKDKFPDIQLIAVVPFSGQSNRRTSSEQERYHRILAKTDKVVTLSENYFRGCLFRRNDYMLSHSCGVIAYYDGKAQGGTFYTVRKAGKMKMDVVNILKRYSLSNHY